MTAAPPTPPSAAPLRVVRRVAIIVIIASLSVTALIGIGTLLLGGGFGDVQGKVMLSTLVIGLFGVLSLCDLAVVGRRLQWSGYLGIAASAVALVISLVLVWGRVGFDEDGIWKTLGISIILAVSLAHANLLLLLGDRRRTPVLVGLWVTVGLISLLALLLILLILTDGDIGTDAYGRLVGTVAILDVLGTIVVPVTGALLRDSAAPGVVLPGAVVPLSLQLPPELDARLRHAAAASGQTPEAIVLTALDRHLSGDR